MKRNILIAALALLTTMGAGVAQAQSRDSERIAADIIGLRLGTRMSTYDRLHDRRAFEDDRFWCGEIHRRYGIQEVVLLQRRRSGLSWLDILADVLWATAHRNDRYDSRTVIYYPQDSHRYIEVRNNDWNRDRYRDRDDWRRDDRNWNDRNNHGRDWDDRNHHGRDWDDRDHNGRNDRDRNDRDRNDRDRNDRNERNRNDHDDHGRNDRDNRNRNDRDGRNDRNNDRTNDRDHGNRRG